MAGMNTGRIKKILSNTGWMLFDKVFILLLNLVVTVKIANHYGTSVYGTYEYAVSVVAIFEILVTLVDARVVKKRYETEDPNELVWNATITRLLFAFVSLVGGLVYLAFSNENGEYCLIFPILLVNAVILSLRFGMQNRYEYLLQSRKVIIASNIALTTGGLLQLFAVSMRLPIYVIAIITAISSFLSLVIVYVQYRNDFGRLIKGHYQKELMNRLIVESLPLAIASSCAIIYSRCDSIMVGNMLSKEDVGIYSIAVKLIIAVQIGIVPIRESVYPDLIQLYRNNREKYKKRYIQVTSILTWTYIIGVLFSFLILPYAFHLLRPEYENAFPIYKVYVISALFMYNAGLRAGHYTLINRGTILMYTQIISVVINVILNYFLIHIIGVFGAALATCITQFVSLMISNLFFGQDGLEVFAWQLKGFNPVYILKKNVDE